MTTIIKSLFFAVLIGFAWCALAGCDVDTSGIQEKEMADVNSDDSGDLPDSPALIDTSWMPDGVCNNKAYNIIHAFCYIEAHGERYIKAHNNVPCITCNVIPTGEKPLTVDYLPECTLLNRIELPTVIGRCVIDCSRC